MKPLVTGCAGFIGSHLTERLLREGYEGVAGKRDSKGVEGVWNIAVIAKAVGGEIGK